MKASKFAIKSVLQVCETAGELLVPHVPQIIGVLLESLSMLEPQIFNYYAQRTRNEWCFNANWRQVIKA